MPPWISTPGRMDEPTELNPPLPALPLPPLATLAPALPALTASLGADEPQPDPSEAATTRGRTTNSALGNLTELFMTRWNKSRPIGPRAAEPNPRNVAQKRRTRVSGIFFGVSATRAT